jgi:hypothetical protein
MWYVNGKAVKVTLLSLSFCILQCAHAQINNWQLVDDFEDHTRTGLSADWYIKDVQNDTNPFVNNPQIALIEHDIDLQNTYYLKKPAADGVLGNRKALSYIALPTPVAVGDTYTFYTRFMVEAFPNNHSFGLSNLSPSEIDKLSYNAFEPMLRVTDKLESNGEKNTGALMAIVKSNNGKAIYADIINPLTKSKAKPLQTGIWYQVWYVVDNATLANGGQRYEIYMQGGEFTQQQKVFELGKFRMAREKALTHFITISNTGSHKKPYGNGGLAYDDIYMIKGNNLSLPER